MSVDVVLEENLEQSGSYVVAALRLFERYGDAEAIVAGERRISFAGLRAQVLDLAATLQNRGIGAGTGVLVLAGNTPELPALQLALHLVGARTMWIAPIAGRREIEAFAQLSDADVFVYDATTKGVLGERLAVSLGVPVHCLGEGGLGRNLLVPAAAEFEPEPHDVEPATCLQTSGTTGEPKLVHHRQAFYEQILTLAADYLAAGLPVLRHLSHSPMAFASGQMTSFFNLFMGGVLFLEDEWDAGRALATIERERINSTYVSPPLLYQLLDHPDLPATDVSSLFMLNVGAGPAAPSRLRQAIERFGPVLRIVYGLSEVIVVTAQPGLTHDPDHPERLRSSGTPYGDVRVAIRDGEGNPLPPGETGEIYTTSKLRFAGYWGRPDLTERAIVDGWVRTGDLGYLDTDGYLYVVDRVQDTIVTGSSNWNIYCRPIEDLLQAHPGVRAAAVIGVPDEAYGEVPHAYVVRYEDAEVTAAELQDLVRDEFNQMWMPRGIEFLAELPLTSAHKVDKVALRSGLRVAMSRRSGLIALFTADVVSVLGNRVSMVAIPWLVLTTTGSPAKMGLIAGAEMLPYVVSGVLAAPLADRFGLRRTSIVTDLGSAVAMAAIVMTPGSSFAWLCLLVAIAGTLRGLGDRVKHVMLKPMADAGGVQMIRVTSSYEGFTRTATLVGAPLGGLLISWIGPNKAIWVDAISFLVCAALVAALVRLPPAAEDAPAPPKEPYFQALRGGFSYLRRDQLLLGMIVMVFFLNVFNQAGTAVFVPLWVEEVLKSPAALGLLFGGFAAGALLGNVIFIVLGPRLPQYASFVIGAAIGGAPRLFALGLSHQLWVVVTVSFGCGIANAAVNPVMGVTLYERVPAALQTRVFGVTGAIAFIGIPIGGVLAGWSAATFGLRPALIASGVILLVVSLVPVYRWWRHPVELARYGSPASEEAA